MFVYLCLTPVSVISPTSAMRVAIAWTKTSNLRILSVRISPLSYKGITFSCLLDLLRHITDIDFSKFQILILNPFVFSGNPHCTTKDYVPVIQMFLVTTWQRSWRGRTSTAQPFTAASPWTTLSATVIPPSTGSLIPPLRPQPECRGAAEVPIMKMSTTWGIVASL